VGSGVRVQVAGSADPDLVNEIMGLIGRYCKAIGVVPHPIELRDTLLAVAALSHLEAASEACTASPVGAEDFADAARETFRDVTGVSTVPAFSNQAGVHLPH